MEHLRYPIGPYSPKSDYTNAELQAFIKIAEEAPPQYRALVAGLSEADLLKTYRESAWNVRQLVHHVADMQLLHFHRMKTTLTEDNAQGSVVNIGGWANTPDATEAPVELSLALFEATHSRLVFLAKTLTEDQWQQSFYHSGRKLDISLKQAIYMTAWHVEHHLAHIKIALGQ